VLRHRRVGDYIYGIVRGSTVLSASVLPGDPFQNRPYGGASAPHEASNQLQTDVIVLIPGMTRQRLLQDSLEIVFFRLDPLYGRQTSGGKDDMTPDRVGTLLTSTPRLVTLSADELKKAVQSLPVR
jgi:hypothetical protein